MEIIIISQTEKEKISDYGWWFELVSLNVSIQTVSPEVRSEKAQDVHLNLTAHLSVFIFSVLSVWSVFWASGPTV